MEFFCYLRFEFLSAPEEGKEGEEEKKKKRMEEGLKKHTSVVNRKTKN